MTRIAVVKKEKCNPARLCGSLYKEMSCEQNWKGMYN